MNLDPMKPPARYQGVRTLVLGATGFIGRWVARVLTQQGADLYLAVRPDTGTDTFEQSGVQGVTVPVDLRTAGSVSTIVERIRPMIVFNLAGYGVDPREDDEALARRLNLGVVQELRQAMAVQAPTSWFGQHIVHAGSALEYGTAGGVLSEDVECLPTTLYGRTKLEATQVLSAVVEMGALRALTARLFTVYGPGEGPWRLLPSLRRVASLKQPLAMTAGHQKRDFTYVGDIAEGMLLLGALARTQVGPVNLATGNLLTVRDFAELAARQLGVPSHLLQFGALPTREWEMDHDPVPIGRLVNLTGWRPLTVPAEGIQRTLAYFASGDPSV